MKRILKILVVTLVVAAFLGASALPSVASQRNNALINHNPKCPQTTTVTVTIELTPTITHPDPNKCPLEGGG
jgi:hypothetical protein